MEARVVAGPEHQTSDEESNDACGSVVDQLKDTNLDKDCTQIPIRSQLREPTVRSIFEYTKVTRCVYDTSQAHAHTHARILTATDEDGIGMGTGSGLRTHMMIVEAFICQVDGHGGSRQGPLDCAPSLPQLSSPNVAVGISTTTTFTSTAAAAIRVPILSIPLTLIQ